MEEKTKLIPLSKRLYGNLRPYRWILVLTIVCMALQSLFSLSRTLLAKYLLDDVLLSKQGSLHQYGYTQRDVLVGLCVVALLLAVVISLTKFACMYLQAYLNNRVAVDIQKEVFNHLMSLSLQFFNNRKMGDLLSRLTNDMGAVTQALRYLYGDLLLQPFMLIFGVGACLYYSWQLSLITFFLMPCLIIPLVQLGKKINRRARKRQSGVAEVLQEMQQVFSGIRVVKSFHGEDFQKREFDRKNEDFFRKAIKVAKTKAMAKSLVEFLNNIGLPIIMGAGGYFILSGGISLTPGDLMAFLTATALMYEPIKSLSKAYNGLQEAMAGAGRTFSLTDIPPKIVDCEGAIALDSIHKGLSFQGITFGYDPDHPVLRDISFSVELGEMVAIVGPSGAGKSTLLDLILRFYNPQAGEIQVDGVDIRRFTLKSYLDQIAVVNQDPYLFHKTIEENIGFGREGATKEDIIQAAQAANIHEFILTLPQGYNTMVGERGVMLSGGQRQRITIARAILKNFTLLLLDEATSSLDTESERLVQSAIEGIIKDHTTFVVAHRLSTIKNADKILILQDGKLVDMGTHQQLMERTPLYRDLYEMQFTSSKESKKNEGEIK